MTDVELDEIINKLREKALGNVIENVVESYKKNENGRMILDNKTIKKIKNDIDTQACIKLIDIELKRRELEKALDPYNDMTDEELEAEKIRLLQELKELETSVIE